MSADVVHFSVDKEESVSLAIGERSEEHTVDDAEHGDVCADAESEREDGCERKPRRLDQDPDRVADISHQAIHQAPRVR
jgi:hypothetical protein